MTTLESTGGLGFKSEILLDNSIPLFSQGLLSIISNEKMKVVALINDLSHIHSLVKSLKPDIVAFYDTITFRKSFKIDQLSRNIKVQCCQTKIILISGCSYPSYISEALNSGIAGFISIYAPPSDFLTGMREVIENRRYVSGSLHIRNNVYAPARKSLSKPGQDGHLTKREYQVLANIIAGSTSAEIGKKLNVSIRTIEAHRGNIMRKLGLNRTSELIAYTFHRGICASN